MTLALELALMAVALVLAFDGVFAAGFALLVVLLLAMGCAPFRGGPTVADSAGWLGNKLNLTPNLDAFAKTAHRFVNNHNTCPICRASLPRETSAPSNPTPPTFLDTDLILTNINPRSEITAQQQ